MLTNGLMSKQDVKRRLDSIFGEYSAFAVNPDDQKKFLQKSKLLENDFKSTTILLDVKQKHVDNQIQSSSNISSIIGQLVNISKPISPVVFEQCDNKLINDSEGELKSEDKFTNKIERSENGLDIIFKQISCISPLLSPISTFSPLLNKISTPLDNNIKQEINSKIDEDKSKNKLKRPNSEEINSTLQETKRPKLAQNNENNNSFIYSIKLCKNSLKKLSNRFSSNCQNEQQKQEEEEKVNEEVKEEEENKEKEAKVNEEKQKEEEKELKEVEEKESLQTLLRRTYEIESAYLDKQRTDCLNEMREAMELVDKMRRKQSSIVNSLKLATGATSGTTDDIDIKIFNLKARMEKIKQGIEELVQRWMKIESICGFSITGPFGEFLFF